MTNLFVKIIACCIFTFSSFMSLSQTGNLDNLRNIVPPSPNASALGKYGEWPVSLYTGVPNITIPVYDMKGRSISMPISLSYHAAGNKVGEVASWVGLGWSLNTGGIISRTVRGIPDDEDGVGYFAMRQLYSNPEDLHSSSAESVWKTHAYNAVNSNADSEPDLYTINLMGRSYKLLFKGDGEILTVPHSNLKITTNAFNNSAGQSAIFWKIILEDGTICSFGGSGYYETNTNPRFGSLVGSNAYTSSWMLKSINSSVGETINFTYTISSVKQDSYISAFDYIKYSTSFGSISTCSPITEASGAKAEIQQVSVLSLSSIENDLARVDFFLNSSTRSDLEGGKSLDQIKIYSKQKGAYIEGYKFNYTYSSAVSSYGYVAEIDTSYCMRRLRLNSFEKRNGSDTESAQMWSFQYDSQNLPSRRSYAQDHWGFYNGAVSNTTLLPNYFFKFPNTYFVTNDFSHGFFPDVHTLGGNKEGDEASMKAEILTGITYPTGGKTAFDYEANSVPVTETAYTNASANAVLHLNSLTSPYIKYAETFFTIAKGQYVKFYMSSYISPGIYSDMPGATASAQITCVSGGCVNGVNLSGSGSGWYTLREPGNYKIKVYTNADQGSFGSTDAIDISATVEYVDSVGNITYNKPVGGLRIKSIINYDFADGQANSKKYFQYESPLVINPVDIKGDYITEQDENICTDHGDLGIEQCTYHVVRRNSSTKFALGNINGGTVGYGKVTTLLGPSGENGKTVTWFSSEPDANVDLAKIFPYPPPESRDWRRGLLLKEVQYNASGVAITETRNSYSFTPVKSLTAFKAGYSTMTSGVITGASPCACTDPYYFCNIERIFYLITTEQVKQSSAITVSYSGSDSLVSSTNFFYDNAANVQPTRTEMTDSRGDAIKIITRTPLEKTEINAATTLTSDASAALDTMINRNILNVQIQQEKYINNILISRSLTNFKNWSSTIVQPQNLQIQKAANSIESRVQFSAYDACGNLLEQSKQYDAKQAYLYGYANTYPIAQVINASYAASAATSFEVDAKGNWDYTSAGDTAAFGSVTGSKAYMLSVGYIIRTALETGTTYVVSYWLKNSSGSVNINSASGGTGLISKNGWTLYQREIGSTDTVRISGTGVIDELRLYPKDAQMVTYTYEPLIGTTSQCDANNRVIYYEYDRFNRLLRIRDADKNILKSFSYTYQEAQ